MGLEKVSKWWKNVVDSANSKGIPLPLARYRGVGNPALTVFLASSILVIIGIVGKWAGHLGGIDMTNAMQFFYASSTLFFGHSWVHKDSPREDLYTPDGDDQNKGPT
jgi:hypothetical protein